MNELQLLLIELNELTSTLLYFIDQQVIVQKLIFECRV
jgi:hypothetical protein